MQPPRPESGVSSHSGDIKIKTFRKGLSSRINAFLSKFGNPWSLRILLAVGCVYIVLVILVAFSIWLASLNNFLQTQSEPEQQIILLASELGNEVLIINRHFWASDQDKPSSDAVKEQVGRTLQHALSINWRYEGEDNDGHKGSSEEEGTEAVRRRIFPLLMKRSKAGHAKNCGVVYLNLCGDLVRLASRSLNEKASDPRVADALKAIGLARNYVVAQSMLRVIKLSKGGVRTANCSIEDQLVYYKWTFDKQLRDIQSNIDGDEAIDIGNKNDSLIMETLHRAREKLLKKLNEDEYQSREEYKRGLYAACGAILAVMTPLVVLYLRHDIRYVQKVTRRLEEQNAELTKEVRRTDKLLYQLLPKHIARRLTTETVDPELYEHTTVFYSDIVGFTKISSTMTPMQVVKFLNKVYHSFDIRIQLYDVFKVETIGDGYVVSSGVPIRNGHKHASEIAGMALDMRKSMQKIRVPNQKEIKVELRMGFHSGSCVAGVVGFTMPRFCLFGETVLTAERMEQNCQASKILISETTFEILRKGQQFKISARGRVKLSENSSIAVYNLEGKLKGGKTG